MSPRTAALAALAVGLIALWLAGGASAHPEDEICALDSGIDPAICRQLEAADRGGASIGPFEAAPIADRSMLETAWLYLEIGVRHILPGGTDHILFVLALFLTSERWRALLWQVSAFTVAHTATLGLAAAGVVSPPAAIVEPLIAASIAVVAVENLIFKDMTRWRPAVVFGFGLIHGLGFAGFLGEVGLPPDAFWPALIGFNIGVEVGQLSVVALAFGAAVLIRPVLRRLDWDYRRAVVVPGSLSIAAIGLWWSVDRVFG
ncbi:MAG: HupE/UreJ family protein [Pseudomonadota bacterium]